MMSGRPVMDEIAVHFKDIYPEFGDLDYEEVLLQQESAFSYIQNNREYRDNKTSEYGQSSSRSLSLGHGSSIESQLALDEALARSLELGDDISDVYIPEHTSIANDNAETTRGETLTRAASQNIRQDDIDPDEMTYEELQLLTESVGTESKGISAGLISRLPTFKYKMGFFSKRKKEKEECVICYSEYKNGNMLTTLPCAHHYHSNCINRWLLLNKHCPVCQKEVQDE